MTLRWSCECSNPGTPQIVDLWLNWLDSGWRVCAPSLLVYEVTNALYRSARARRIGPKPLAASLQDLEQMKLELVSDVALSRRAAEMAWALEPPAAPRSRVLRGRRRWL